MKKFITILNILIALNFLYLAITSVWQFFSPIFIIFGISIWTFFATREGLVFLFSLIINLILAPLFLYGTIVFFGKKENKYNYGLALLGISWLINQVYRFFLITNYRLETTDFVYLFIFGAPFVMICFVKYLNAKIQQSEKDKKSFVKTPFFILGILIILGLVAGHYFIKQKSILTLNPIPETDLTVNPILETDPTLNWQRYINDKYNFEIKIPEDWKEYPDPQSQSQDSKYLVKEFVPSGQNEEAPTTFLYIYISPANGHVFFPGLQTQEQFDQLLSLDLSSPQRFIIFPVGQAEKIGQGKVGGVDAIKFVKKSVYDSQGERYDGLLTWFRSQNVNYYIVLSGIIVEGEQQLKLIDEYEKVLSTFRFLYSGDWKVYTNQQMGITFQHPDTLFLLDATKKEILMDGYLYLGSNMVGLNIDKEFFKGFDAYISCKTAPVNEDCLFQGSEWGQSKDVEDVVVGGKQAKSFYIKHRYILDSSILEQSRHAVQILGPSPLMIVIMFDTDSADIDGDAMFKKILSTIQFLSS